MGFFPAIAVLVGLLAAAPPLTEAQRRQLDTATDASPRLDEGALYPLLRNALQWDDASNPEAGARIPDYAALRESPAAQRGEVFLIEGVYQGGGEFNLHRSGPWGDALRWWVIKHGKTADDVAVVYFVTPSDGGAGDGGEGLPAVRRGAKVRVPARFYKVWRDVDQNEQRTDFLTFVARRPRVVASSPVSPSLGLPEMLLLVVILAGGVAVLIWRSKGLSFKPRPLPRQAARAAAAAAEEQGELGDENDPLPEDPALALDELSRRHEKEP